MKGSMFVASSLLVVVRSFAIVSIPSTPCLCLPGVTLTLTCCVLVPQTGYNLVMCNYALSDREGMKNAFQKLLKVRL